jgi:hypothetical protein
MTNENAMQIITEGGLRDKIKLAGQELVVGELKLKDRPRLFAAIEGEMLAYYRTAGRAERINTPGLLAALWGFIFGHRRARFEAQMERIMNDVTEHDIQIIGLCTGPFNDGLTKRRLRELVLESHPSEIRDAIKKVFDVNHIQEKGTPKNRRATAGKSIPTGVA